jgi:nitrite reductase (NO-forming)
MGLIAVPAWATPLGLPRQAVKLVNPPFVHAHEQVAHEGPKIMEFRLVVEEKEMSSTMRVRSCGR